MFKWSFPPASCQDQITSEQKLHTLKKEYEKLQKILTTTTIDMDKFKMENGKLKKKGDDYKRKYEQCNKEKDKLQELLNQLVDKVIEKFEEQQGKILFYK